MAFVDKDHAALDRVVKEFSNYKTLVIQCDVTDEKQAEMAVKKVVSEFGRLDAAFNYAGVQSPPVETADATSEEYDKAMDINLRGIWTL